MPAIFASWASPPPLHRSRADGYARHRPEETALYRIVAEHWASFVAEVEEHGSLPKFVVSEFEAYLRCGRLEHGLVRVGCPRCGHELVVAFSCKRRTVCPSCAARRMNDLAAHLCDEILPEVPMRQWVCSLPFGLRCVLGYDRELCAAVLDAFIRALSCSQRKRAKRELGLSSVSEAHVGAVTFIQRFDSALRLNVHFHTLGLDGVYVRSSTGDAVFHRLGEPTAGDVEELARGTAERVRRVLERAGRSFETDDCTDDALATDQPTLGLLYGAAVQGKDVSSGRSTRVLRTVVARRPGASTKLVAEVDGVNVQAGASIDGADRTRLERLCRYIARPALALGRLSVRDDGRVVYRLSRPWSDGTRAVLFAPHDFLARLCALIPPPRFHMLRYHGVFAARASMRGEIVGIANPDDAAPAQLSLFEERDLPCPREPELKTRSSRTPWPSLLRRVFAVDIARCPRCAAAMRVLEVLTDLDAIARVLHRHGLGPRPPPKTRTAFGKQLQLHFA